MRAQRANSIAAGHSRNPDKPPAKQHPHRDVALRMLELRGRAITLASEVINNGQWLDRQLELMARDKRLTPMEKQFLRMAATGLVRHKLLLNYLAQQLWPSVPFEGEGVHSEALALLPVVWPESVAAVNEELSATLRSFYGHVSESKAAEAAALLASADIPIATHASINPFTAEKGNKDYGIRWRAMALALNETPPCFLRYNPFKGSLEALIESLIAAGYSPTVIHETAGILSLPDNNGLFSTDAFLKGLFEVQDWSSQQIAPFAKPLPGLRVLDACAGQGGKTLHLSTLMQNKGKIIATDASTDRLTLLKLRARRADAQNIEIRENLWNQGPRRIANQFDRVLIDAPCSGSGAWRRNPGLKWGQNEEMLQRLTAEQAGLLKHYAQGVKSGGYLVYATCSIWADENRDQVDRFLADHPGQWELEEELHLAPDTHPGDGFYAARLKRI